MYAFEPKRQVGRPKGTPNKTTVRVKAALERAFEGIGGMEAFVGWARENPTEFYRLWSKLLPMELKADIKHTGSITVIVETGVPRAPDESLIGAV
jgi:hypothetical protein